jgi:putative endonuclease
VVTLHCTAPTMRGQTILPVEVAGLRFDGSMRTGEIAQFGCWLTARCAARRYHRVVHFVYIVRCADGTLYTGYARDPHARVQLHNRGRGARYTSGRRPVSLVYSESFATIGEALRRERQLKRLRRAAKEALAGLIQPWRPRPIPASAARRRA